MLVSPVRANEVITLTITALVVADFYHLEVGYMSFISSGAVNRDSEDVFNIEMARKKSFRDFFEWVLWNLYWFCPRVHHSRCSERIYVRGCSKKLTNKTLVVKIIRVLYWNTDVCEIC